MQLHIKIYEGEWCPMCRRWMGWLDNETGFMDHFGTSPPSDHMHANCMGPFTRPQQSTVRLPRFHISRKSFEELKAEAERFLD